MYLYVTEYSNMGDVAAESPVEPALRVQRVDVGGESEPIHNDTRCVVLLATFPCRVAFSAGGDHEDHAWPLPAGELVTRMVRPNTNMTVKAFAEEVMM